MQIHSIILYNKAGQKRVLPFELGKVNIITGESKTGKTAIIDIVNYCLGSDDCKISDGVIRDTVEWFSVLFQLDSEQLFVARQNPNSLGQASTSHIYLANADTVEPPELSQIANNSDIETLKDYLTRKMRISEFTNTPESGTRDPLAVNFKHSRFYSFQPQDLIDQREFLFYNQADNYTAQSMKDTLPYFLGAVPEDAVRIEREISALKREQNRLVKQLKENQRLVEEGSSRIFALVDEAKALNLIAVDAPVTSTEAALAILNEVVKLDFEAEYQEGENENLKKLIDEKNALGKELASIKDEIKAVQSFIDSTNNYSSEASQQVARLQSVGLFSETEASHDSCPLCNSQLTQQIPSITAINQSLSELSANLTTTTTESPRLNKFTDDLLVQRDRIKEQMETRQASIQAIYREQDDANRLRNVNIRRGKTIGRISLFLESFEIVEADNSLALRVEFLEDQIKGLESQISADERDARISAILNHINTQMTTWGPELDLEYKDAPLRFDIKKLTIFIDRITRSVPLNQAGSGANWVAFHLLIHFALHKHFVLAGRPVPHFLILDQPSQAYYPPARDNEYQGTIPESSDERAVRQMYEFIFKVTNELSPNFQVIITDHAKLREQYFQDAILEEWRNGEKLIPNGWINQS
ncbi:MAG: hypothetical protein BGO69_10650 [Bacteroidetes bacterium 46-16]|nr:MAG: hypothetical protein BGO69_10650 [Bacteroidetes bacterium 46-16]